MIQKEDIRLLTNEFLEKEKGVEITDISVSADNVIRIELDSYEGIDLELCVALNKFLNDRLDRDKEDYELEVGSVSLTDAFKTRMQFDKNLGHEVEVLQADGQKFCGVLVEVGDTDFSVDVEQMVKVEGQKRKHKQITTMTWAYNEVKSVRYLLKV